MGGSLLQFRRRGGQPAVARPPEGRAWPVCGGVAEARATGDDLAGAGLGEPIDLDAVPRLPPIDHPDPASRPPSGAGLMPSAARKAATRGDAPRPPTRSGDVFGIAAAPVALPVRNPLAVAPPADIAARGL